MTANTSPFKFTVKKARLAFPVLWTPESGPDGGKPRYSAALIIPTDHEIIPALKVGMEAKATEKWGAAKAVAICRVLYATDKMALHDGDLKAQYEGYEGNMYISTGAQATARPTCIDRNRNPATESDGILYSGCYVNAIIELWAQDHPKGGKRINATLKGVQFHSRGDAFSGGGKGAEAEEFEDLGPGDDDDDPTA